MECKYIQEKLSAYIEETLSSEEIRLIDEHLKSCQKCNESLTDLRKIVSHLHNLEEVEPPPWLTQKVIARIRSDGKTEKGILQRLFYPLHVKLPIEAVAVVLIAITTFYIFKTIQTEVKLAETPSEEVTTQTFSREREEVPAFEESKPSPAQPVKQPIPGKKQKIKDKVAEAPEVPATTLKQPEIPSEDEAKLFEGTAQKEEPKTEVLSRAPKAKSLDKRKEESISFTINVNDMKTVGKEIESTLMQLGGRIIKTESFENKAILTADLDSKKVNTLHKKLNQIGEVKTEAVALETIQGVVEIRIEILESQCDLNNPSCPHM